MTSSGRSSARRAEGPGSYYLKPLLDGYAAFASGRSDSISGAVAVDKYTLQLRETRPDRSIVDLMAMSFSAPIPPSPPGAPESSLGVATGHDFRRDWQHPLIPPANPGYGPFQVATGPYMIAGGDQVDFSVPASQQQVPTGFTPSWWGWWNDKPPDAGRLILVRNPSWDQANDPNRPAYPDRIEISIQPPTNPYRGLWTGSVDSVIGENLPDKALAGYRTAQERGRVFRGEANQVDWVTLNLLQPPFDDVHVRRAFALVLNRQAVRSAMIHDVGATSIGDTTSHIVPNAQLDNLLAGWQAEGNLNRRAAHRAALVQLNKSRYWSHGHCRGPACGPIRVGSLNDHPGVAAAMEAAVRALGMHPTFTLWDYQPATDCSDPVNHFAICFFGWPADYPSTAAMFPPFLDHSGYNDSGLSTPGTGASPADLRKAGLPARPVPSVQPDFDRCATALPSQATLCWARLDQWLTAKVVAVVPTNWAQWVRIAGARVSAFSVDQAYGEPALDRLAVEPAS